MFNFCFYFLYMYHNQPWAEGFLRICALEMIVIITIHTYTHTHTHTHTHTKKKKKESPVDVVEEPAVQTL